MYACLNLRMYVCLFVCVFVGAEYICTHVGFVYRCNFDFGLFVHFEPEAETLHDEALPEVQGIDPEEVSPLFSDAAVWGETLPGPTLPGAAPSQLHMMDFSEFDGFPNQVWAAAGACRSPAGEPDAGGARRRQKTRSRGRRLLLEVARSKTKRVRGARRQNKQPDLKPEKPQQEPQPQPCEPQPQPTEEPQLQPEKLQPQEPQLQPKGLQPEETAEKPKKKKASQAKKQQHKDEEPPRQPKKQKPESAQTSEATAGAAPKAKAKGKAAANDAPNGAGAVNPDTLKALRAQCFVGEALRTRISVERRPGAGAKWMVQVHLSAAGGKTQQVGQVTQSVVERHGGSLPEAVDHVNDVCKKLDTVAAVHLAETDVVRRLVAESIPFAPRDLGDQD